MVYRIFISKYQTMFAWKTQPNNHIDECPQDSSSSAKSFNCNTSHSLSPSTENHVQITKSIVQNQNLMEICPKHSRKKDIICMDDEQTICSHCAIFDYHKGHSFVPLVKARQEILEYFENHQNYEKYCKEEYPLTVRKSKEQSIRRLTQRKQELIKKLKRSFIDLYKLLQVYETEQYKNIHKHFGTIEKKVLSQFKELQEKQFSPIHTPVYGDIGQFYVNHVKDRKLGYIEFQRQMMGHKLTEIKKVLKTKQDLVVVDFSQEKIHKFLKGSISTNFQTDLRQKNVRKSSIESIHRPNSRAKLEVKENKLSYCNSQSKLSLGSLNCQRQNPLECTLKNIQNQTLSNKTIQGLVEVFLTSENKDILDLSGVRVNNLQTVLYEIRKVREIPRIKLNRNMLTDTQILKMLPFLDSTESINLSCNNLTDQSLGLILQNMPKRNKLNVINLSRNQYIHQGKREVKEKVAEFKNKFGIMVMI